MLLEVELERNGVKVEWSASEQGKLLDFFLGAGSLEETWFLEHLLDYKGGCTSADDDTLLFDGVKILFVIGVVIDDKMDFAWNTIKLSSKLVEIDKPNTFNLRKDLTLLILEIVLEYNIFF